MTDRKLSPLCALNPDDLSAPGHKSCDDRLTMACECDCHHPRELL